MDETMNLNPSSQGASQKGEAGSTKASPPRPHKVSRPLQSRGHVHILATFNNTLVTVSDINGNVLTWASAGKCGFKGPKKATPYAAGVIIRAIADKVKEMGIREIEVFVRGVGAGRESAVRALAANGFLITAIRDVTPIPHNGVRAPKPRRI
ncbi:MAG: 30S ribosomal protein S11 [Patescibacteria group bacterium]